MDQSTVKLERVVTEETPRKRATVESDEPRKSTRARASALPMPHSHEADEDSDEDIQMTAMPMPMWDELWHKCGMRPVDERKCVGCQFARLNVPTLPFEAMTTLARGLPTRIRENGLYAAVMWSDTYYRENVLAFLPPDDQARLSWDGASILWHYAKHAYMAQYREVIEEIELTYLWDDTLRNRAYVRPVFASGRPGERQVDPSTLRSLASIRQMVHRQRNIEIKKRITFHDGLGSTAAAASAPLAREKYTGQGLLNSRKL